MRFFLISSILLSTAAWANDGVFLGSGGDVYPIENDQIAMAKETLVIEETGPWRWGVGGWKVTVEYVFENTTDASVRLQFGFPEKCRREPGDIDDENAFVCDSPGIKDFRAWLDGKPRTVSVKRFRPEKKRALNHRGFGRVHTFEVTFAPKQRRRVKHTYSVGGYADSAMGAGVEYGGQSLRRHGRPCEERAREIIHQNARIQSLTALRPHPRATFIPSEGVRGTSRRGDSATHEESFGPGESVSLPPARHGYVHARAKHLVELSLRCSAGSVILSQGKDSLHPCPFFSNGGCEQDEEHGPWRGHRLVFIT
jgi:hypothetical protein